MAKRKIIKQKREIKKRRWKNLPYWLKGGIIFLVIVLVDFLILYLLSINNNLIIQNKFFGYLIAPLSLLRYIFSFFTQFCTGLTCTAQEGVIYAVISLLVIFIFYFIFGALIGLVYGKTKKGNKNINLN